MEDNFGLGYAMGADSSNNNNDLFGGGGWGGLIGLLIVASLFGNGGWGFGGGFGGGGMGMMMNGIATRADINEGFALNNITGGITAIQQGICDSTYALNNAITNGFHGVDRGLCDVSHQISDCCCTTQNAIQNVRYDLSTGLCNLGNAISTQTRDIIDNQNANYRAMMDFMVNEKLASQRDEIQSLRMEKSQYSQNGYFAATIDAAKAEILRRTGHDYPTGCYLVQPPTPINFPTNGCGQVQFNGYGNGGCGCGC